MTDVRAQRDADTIHDDRCRTFMDRIEVVGRKWNGGILLAAMRGARRFSEFRTRVDGISDRLLALRLRELEREGLLRRTVEPTTPVTVRYEPTERGRSLMQAMEPLVDWAQQDEASARRIDS
jgi:DNA-binding HxlR family transcriptional regulator